MLAEIFNSRRIRFTNCPTEREWPPRAKNETPKGTWPWHYDIDDIKVHHITPWYDDMMMWQLDLQCYNLTYNLSQVVTGYLCNRSLQHCSKGIPKFALPSLKALKRWMNLCNLSTIKSRNKSIYENQRRFKKSPENHPCLEVPHWFFWSHLRTKITRIVLLTKCEENPSCFIPKLSEFVSQIFEWKSLSNYKNSNVFVYMYVYIYIYVNLFWEFTNILIYALGLSLGSQRIRQAPPVHFAVRIQGQCLQA